MEEVRTRSVRTGPACPACGRANSSWSDACVVCGAALRPPVMKPDWLVPAPEPVERIVNPYVVLGVGALLAPLFALTPLLQYMAWFLASLVHEIGHCVVAWFFGQPAYPAIRLDGHAAAIHRDQVTLLVIAIGLGLAWLTYALRRHRHLRIAAGVVLAVYPILALTGAKEVLHLLAGHAGELVFAGVFFYRALSGGFTESLAERFAYGTMAWLLLGRNVVLDLGLMTSAGARSHYAGSGSFGLTNDFIRAARELGISLEGVAALMLLLAVATLPLAWWAWRRLDFDPAGR